MHEHQQPAAPTVYSCPMHPNIQRSQPGLCPECGMKLLPQKAGVARKDQEGLNKHEGHHTQQFARKFWVCLALTIPVLLYSDLFRDVLNIRLPDFAGVSFMPLVFGSIVFFYGGLVFLQGAWRELRAKMPGMMTLISLAILSAYLFSLFSQFYLGGETLYWEITTLITIMLLGHWLEMRAVSGAQGALKELAKLLPDTAEVMRDGKLVVIPLAELKVGDVFIVKPGGKVAADGIIVEGKSELNESMITGESKPVEKDQGGRVIAGTINGDGGLSVKVEQIGEKTFLAGVMRLVAEAQSSKSRLQVLSDKAAFLLTIIAVTVGVITLIAWLAAGAGASTAVTRLVAVLVIACPHALGLAVPLVASISTTKAARAGVLVKQRLALEAARTIDTVLMDKTGTLTKGEFGISEILTAGVSEVEALKIYASVNSHSEHPIAQAVVKAAKERGLTFAEVKNFERIAGRGVRGKIGKDEILIGSEVLFTETNISIPEAIKKQLSVLAKQGKTINILAVNGTFAGAFALADMIREESRQAIRQLKELGISVAMITGDSEDVAAWVAKELGIDEYFARVLPEKKSEKVKELQQQGRKVAMVGDGVNDAPALTQADLGIAIGAGTNVAIESAGIILVKSDPADIVKIVRLSQLTYAKMLQNLFWATGYNVLAIPLAAGVLAYKGIILQPAFAAVLMSLSTVIVAVNALLLKRRVL